MCGGCPRRPSQREPAPVQEVHEQARRAGKRLLRHFRSGLLVLLVARHSVVLFDPLRIDTPHFFICSRACSAFGSARGTVAGPPPDSISFSPLYRGTSRGRTRSGTRSAAAGAGFAAARARPPVATDFVGSFPDFFTILLAAFCTTFFVAFLPALLAGLATTARFIACAGLGAGFFEAFLADFPDGFFADFFAGMGFSDSGGQRGFLFRPS